jgi:hypothetical protein
MVVAENSVKALAPLNGVMEQGGGYGLQESVFEPLMITLGMVMRHKLPDCVLKGRSDQPNMTAYPSVRKPALDAPEPIELEFVRDRYGSEKLHRLVRDHARP